MLVSTELLDNFALSGFLCGHTYYANKLLKSGNSLINEIAIHRCHRIETMNGFGPTMVSALLNNYYLLQGLKLYANPKSTAKKAKPTASKQLTFVITGTLSQPRKYYEDRILAAGHKCNGLVSKNTAYVLAGADAGSKLAKAKELGVRIISEDKLEGILSA